MFEQQTLGQSGYSLQKHVTKTFMIMGLGLLVSAVVALIGYVSGFSLRLLFSFGNMSYFLLLAVQLGVVFMFTRKLYQMNYSRAMLMYMIYAVTTGIVFGTLGYLYAGPTIFFAFGVTALYFGSLTMIGMTTKMDLTKVGNVCFVGLLVLIVVELLGMFFFDTNTMLINGIAILIFTGLTAYDVQKIKYAYYQYEHDSVMLKHLALYAAFELYLDFINLFLRILSVVGDQD